MPVPETAAAASALAFRYRSTLVSRRVALVDPAVLPKFKVNEGVNHGVVDTADDFGGDPLTDRKFFSALHHRGASTRRSDSLLVCLKARCLFDELLAIGQQLHDLLVNLIDMRANFID